MTGNLTNGDYNNGNGTKLFTNGYVTARNDNGDGGLILYRNGTEAANQTVNLSTLGVGWFGHDPVSGNEVGIKADGTLGRITSTSINTRLCLSIIH